MGKAYGFEELKVWQAVRELVQSIYKATNNPKLNKDTGLRDQLKRAAVSAMANIAEGFERGSNREFVRFLYMARGSAGEVRSHLYVAKDLDYITQEEFERIGHEAVRLSKGVFAFIRHVGSSAPTVR
jgi:four helix bundle protein